jgi:hypothetical protein
MGNVGSNIGTSTMMAHAGGRVVTYQDVCDVPIPEDTDTYTSISHEAYVRGCYDHGQRLLEPKGFKLSGQRFVLANNGNRMFFVQSYLNGDSELRLALAGRNSYDKSLSAALAFGAVVFNCDNTCIRGDSITVFRRHSGDAIRKLEDQVILAMYRAHSSWDAMRDERDTWASIPLSVEGGYGLMGKCKAMTAHSDTKAERLLDSPSEWDEVVEYWEDPKHDYAGGNHTLWAWYNSFTFGWRDLNPTVTLQRHAALHRFCQKVATQQV